jgi:hypothetical protein
MLDQGVRRLKAGPVEVEFDQLQAEVREELARSPELAGARIPAPAGGFKESCPGSPKSHLYLRS